MTVQSHKAQIAMQVMQVMQAMVPETSKVSLPLRAWNSGSWLLMASASMWITCSTVSPNNT